MIIGVDGRELTKQPAGKGAYLGSILSLLQQQNRCEIRLYIQAGTSLPSNHESSLTKLIEVEGSGLIWHKRVAARLKTDGVEVFWAVLSYFSAIFNPIPTVTVVHDLAVFQPTIRHNRRSQLIEKLILRQACKRSKALIAVSNSTVNDLEYYCKVPANRVAVVGCAPLLVKGQSVSSVEYKDRQPYLLFVGTLEPRKNVKQLLNSFAKIPSSLRNQYRLKLAGKPGWGGEGYAALAKELGIAEWVDFLGYVSDQNLRQLYSFAQGLVYPSWYEGFGMPVVEAMASGTPVITSTTSSLPEITGSAALLVNPSDGLGLTQAMERLLTEPGLFRQLQKAGLDQVKKFDWQQSAHLTEQILIKVTGP